MASLRTRLVAAALFATGAVLSGPLPRTAAQQNPETFIFNACPLVAEHLRSPGGLENLINPAFRTGAAIEAAIPDRRDMLTCLESVRFRTVLPDWFNTVRYHLELFLSFAILPPGSDGRSLELIDLSTVDDPAAARLRGEVGLAPPEGLVLVRYFPTRAAMPPNIRRAFEDPETQAVTMSSRYVAVLTPAPRVAGETGNRALGATFSHEMVHAFLNAGLEWSDPTERFPSWFHEGMAIHFSGSGRVHVTVDPSGGRVLTTPTSEYERYERIFLYLEARLGEVGLHRAIRTSVGEVDTGPLLGSAGAVDYDDLLEDAELWWRWWPVPVRFVEGGNIWLSASVVLMLLVVAVGMWRRWQPAVPGSSLEVNLNNDLIAAIRSGDLEELQYLLKSGANPNARDRENWSALLWAVWLGHSLIADLLVDQGARVTSDVRHAAAWRDDPDIERVVADATTRQREVW